MRRLGCSLSSIMLLTAVAAIVVSGLREVLVTFPKPPPPTPTIFFAPRPPPDPRVPILLAGGFGVLVGAIVGFGWGITRPWPVKGVLIGTPAGAAAGAIAGLLAVSAHTAPVMLAGAAILLVMVGVFHFGSRRPPE